MRRMSSRHKRFRRGGAAAVEMAFVLPFMVLLALGCVDFGRFAYTYIAVQNAARAGAAYAIMTPYLAKGKTAWDSAIQDTARTEMTNQTGYVASNLTTTAESFVEKTGLRRVYVKATYSYFQTIITWPGIPSQTPVVAAVEMRVIR